VSAARSRMGLSGLRREASGAVVAVLLAFSAGGCTFTGAAYAQPVSCDAAAKETVRVTPLDVEKIASELTWADGTPEGSLLVLSGRRLEGLCAAELETANSGFGRWRGGGSFHIESDGILALRDSAVSLLDGADLPASVLKDLPSGLVASDHVSIAPRDRAHYVGAWTSHTGNMVYSFTTAGDGVPESPKALLQSQLPIESIRYFPAPDAPSGALTLLLRDTDGSRLLVVVRWSHGSWFDG